MSELMSEQSTPVQVEVAKNASEIASDDEDADSLDSEGYDP